MRFLIEIILAAALIALAWEKSLKERASELPWLGDKKEPVVKTPAQPPPPQQPQPQIRTVVIPAPAPTASGDWMWDPNHHKTLDRPAYDPKDPSVRYRDPQGRKYWIDAKGVRHYDP